MKLQFCITLFQWNFFVSAWIGQPFLPLQDVFHFLHIQQKKVFFNIYLPWVSNLYFTSVWYLYLTFIIKASQYSSHWYSGANSDITYICLLMAVNILTSITIAMPSTFQYCSFLNKHYGLFSRTDWNILPFTTLEIVSVTDSDRGTKEINTVLIKLHTSGPLRRTEV